jgi:hypothetical protein
MLDGKLYFNCHVDFVYSLLSGTEVINAYTLHYM